LKKHSKSIDFIYKGMESYLKKHPNGKKFHDPLAACCAINPSIGVWENVVLFREKGKWGSKLINENGIKIIIDYDKKKFIDTLIEV